MGDSWRIGVDQKEITALKTKGIYEKSRNPIYYGIFVFWLGLVLTFPYVLLWLCALVCWLCIEVIVRKIEEPYLQKIHGKKYENYIYNTNRFKPFCGLEIKEVRGRIEYPFLTPPNGRSEFYCLIKKSMTEYSLTKRSFNYPYEKA